MVLSVAGCPQPNFFPTLFLSKDDMRYLITILFTTKPPSARPPPPNPTPPTPIVCLAGIVLAQSLARPWGCVGDALSFIATAVLNDKPLSPFLFLRSTIYPNRPVTFQGKIRSKIQASSHPVPNLFIHGTTKAVVISYLRTGWLV